MEEIMNQPWIKWMREKYYLSRNPFPRDAILAQGSDESCENGTIFNPEVSPKEVEEFLDKFVLQPTYVKGSGFGALWSLGLDDEARGFGKSSLGLYSAKKICADFGFDMLISSGLSEKEAKETPLISSLAAFDKQNVNNFNAVAFEHVMWLTESFEGLYDKSPIERLRERIIEIIDTDGKAKSGGSNKAEAISEKVEDVRVKIKGKIIGPLNEEFLNHLIYSDNITIKKYLQGVSVWQRTRNGFVYLDTLLTFAIAAGIKKAILFIDQVEDFASTGIPLSKRTREVERFRDIVKETGPFNSIVYYILTMHPRALTAIENSWEDARLPSLRYDVPENRERTVVLRGIQSDDESIKLFASYLEHPDYRLKGASEVLHPFSKDAISLLRERNGGRAGYMLIQAHNILQQGAIDNVEIVDKKYALKVISGRKEEKTPTAEVEVEQTRKGIPKGLE
jgi:hypothetical protein